MRPFLRYVLLIVLLALQALALAGVIASNGARTEAVLREHAEAVLNHLADTAAENTRRFLAPAERSADLTRRLLEAGVLRSEDLGGLERHFLEQLRANPELNSLYLGRPDGGFVFVTRTPKGFQTKRIEASNGRSTGLTTRDADLRVIDQRADPADRFDPRLRPWYALARQSRGVVWTDPYVFFTSKRPGVTAAAPARSPDGRLLGVAGADIEIGGLSAFLGRVPISPNGSAFVVSRDGLAVAFPGLERVLEGSPARALPQASEAAGPGAKALLAARPLEGAARPVAPKFSEFSAEGRTEYGVLRPFSIGGGVTWTIGVRAPAADFVGEIGVLDRNFLTQVLFTELAVALLAVPLVFGASRPLLRLYKQATTDALTGLPNRAEFLRRAGTALEQARRNGRTAAVVMLDLDGFKAINDTHGHQVGDEVLAAAARHIARAVRCGDLVGRLGGDEFAIVLKDVRPDEVGCLVDRVREGVAAEPIRSSAGLHRVGASAGVVLGRGGAALLERLAEADRALLQAKAQGKNRTLVTA